MSKSLASAAPSGFALRLVLEELGDRISQRIEILGPPVAGSTHVLAALASVEGTSDEEWPPSPPLQSCSIQEVRPHEDAAFLVGMAGKSHWSASIEPVTGRGEFIFDFACRVQQAPRWLGTTYRLDLPSQGSRVIAQPGPGQFAWDLGKCNLSFVTEETAGLPRGVIRLDDSGRLQIACAEGPPVTRATTLRWRYRIGVQAAS